MHGLNSVIHLCLIILSIKMKCAFFDDYWPLYLLVTGYMKNQIITIFYKKLFTDLKEKRRLKTAKVVSKCYAEVRSDFFFHLSIIY